MIDLELRVGPMRWYRVEMYDGVQALFVRARRLGSDQGIRFRYQGLCTFHQLSSYTP